MAVKKATCGLQGDSVHGFLEFSQENINAPTKITGEIGGLKPGKHGIHIHEFGDITKHVDCTDHYNPHGKDHGGPGDPNRHLGDLGNVIANDKGVAKVDMVDRMVTLNGALSVIGRKVVVHDKEDDLGRAKNEESRKTGNTGDRACWGVIGIAKPE